MESMLSVSFYIQRKRTDVKREVPIVIRVRLHNQRRNISSGLRIKPECWNSKFNAVKGSSEAAKQINKLLDISKNRLFEIFTQLSYGDYVMLDDVVDAFLGKSVAREQYLLKLVREHNKHIMSRIGKDYTKSTFQKYWAMEIRVSQYVTKHLQKQDIPLLKLDRKFVAGFFLYLYSATDKNVNF